MADRAAAHSAPLYQGALIMTHRDGDPRFSARSAWRGDVGHRKPCGTPSALGAESLGLQDLEKPPPVARANRQWAPLRASASRDDPSSAAAALPLRRVGAPHRLRPPSCSLLGPADRPRDLYGSLSALLGISSGQRMPGFLTAFFRNCDPFFSHRPLFRPDSPRFAARAPLTASFPFQLSGQQRPRILDINPWR